MCSFWLPPFGSWNALSPCLCPQRPLNKIKRQHPARTVCLLPLLGSSQSISFALCFVCIFTNCWKPSLELCPAHADINLRTCGMPFLGCAVRILAWTECLDNCLGRRELHPCFATSDLDLSCCILTTVRRQVIFPYRKVSPCQIGLWNKEVGFGCWSWSEPWRTTFGTWFCLGTICLSLKALFTFIILQEVALPPWLADSIESSHFYASLSSTNLQ